MPVRYQGLPHDQALLEVDPNNLQALRPALLSSLARFVGLKKAFERDERVDFQLVLKDRARHLPLAVADFKVRHAGMPYDPDRPLAEEVVPSTMRFTPKHEGVTTGAAPNRLIDASANFLDFETKVRAGDPVAVVQAGSEPNTVEILQTTEVVSVVSATELEVADDWFPSGTMYEVHWPYDVKRTYSLARYVDLVLDVYADPDAVPGSGETLEEVESKIRAWVRSAAARVVLALNDSDLRATGYRAVDLSGLVPPEGAQRSFLKRLNVTVPLVVGETAYLYWPTVETIRVSPEATPEGDSASQQFSFEQSEDDTR